jgi:hypothetical protein
MDHENAYGPDGKNKSKTACGVDRLQIAKEFLLKYGLPSMPLWYMEPQKKLNQPSDPKENNHSTRLHSTLSRGNGSECPYQPLLSFYK